MKNRLLKICIILLCVMLFPVVVTAHSGKTDDSGGHYDTETGEYHYHHGYPAHQHYDMNGDGVIDCPYNFDDKTDNSGSSSDNSNNGSSSTNNTNRNNNQISFWDVVKTVLLMIPMSLMTLWILYLVVSLLCVVVQRILQNIFDKYIEDEKMKKIQSVLIKVLLAIAVVVEFICLLSR